METTKLKENWKELQKEITSLKKSLNDFKEVRKTEWKTFKNKFIDDMDQVEKSLKKLAVLHKK